MDEWIDEDFSDEDIQVVQVSSLKAAVPTKRKSVFHDPKKSGKQAGITRAEIPTELWLTTYSPLSVNEVAGNKAKIEQLANWLRQTAVAKIDNSEKIVVLTGPSGCGKTAAILAICNELKISVQHWSGESQEYTALEQRGDNSIPYQSQIELFDSFLTRASRYRQIPLSLDSVNKTSQVVLLEDLPPHFFRNPHEFHNRMRSYNKTAKSVLIIIFNTSLEVSERAMFPESLLKELNIKYVSFNPIPKTEVKKVLTRISDNEKALSIPKEYILALSESCNGDIRSAINTMQFTFSARGGVDNSKPAVKRQRLAAGKKSTKANNPSLSETKESLEDRLKDPTVILFRALGKILYCKRTDLKDEAESLLPTHLLHHARNSMAFDPEQVFQQAMVSPDFYTLCLQQNFPSFLVDLENVRRAAEYLSDADVLSDRFESRIVSGSASPGVSVAARGLMHSNTCMDRKHSWQQMRKPQWYMVNRQSMEHQNSLSWKNNSPYSTTALALDLLPALQMMRISNELASILPPYTDSYKHFISESLDDKDSVPDADFNDFTSMQAQNFNDKEASVIDSKASDVMDDPSEFFVEDCG